MRSLPPARCYLDTDPFVRLVRPQLDECGKHLDETLHLGRLDGSDIVYLATHGRVAGGSRTPRRSQNRT